MSKNNTINALSRSVNMLLVVEDGLKYLIESSEDPQITPPILADIRAVINRNESVRNDLGKILGNVVLN